MAVNSISTSSSELIALLLQKVNERKARIPTDIALVVERINEEKDQMQEEHRKVLMKEAKDKSTDVVIKMATGITQAQSGAKKVYGLARLIEELTEDLDAFKLEEKVKDAFKTFRSEALKCGVMAPSELSSLPHPLQASEEASQVKARLEEARSNLWKICAVQTMVEKALPEILNKLEQAMSAACAEAENGREIVKKAGLIPLEVATSDSITTMKQKMLKVNKYLFQAVHAEREAKAGLAGIREAQANVDKLLSLTDGLYEGLSL